MDFRKGNIKKLKIICMFFLVVILGLILLCCISNVRNENNETISDDLNVENEILESTREIEMCKYEIFEPTFKLADGTYYDFRDEMEEQDMILYKKINTYQDYLEIKSKWDSILDMTENDFENSFMIITSVWNKDMTGLVVDDIETDNDTLYISLIKDVHMNEADEKKIGISYIIPRTMERKNILCVRNFDDKEKDFNTGMKIGKLWEGIISPTTFQYRDKSFQEETEKSDESNSINYKVIEPEWKDMMCSNFALKSDIADIDFGSWQNMENGYYYLTITDYSEYAKLMKDYDIEKLTWHDFQYIYSVVILNTNSNNIIKTDNIISDSTGTSYLPIYSETDNNIDEDVKYQGMVVVLPNYRNLQSNYLQLKLK